MDEAAACIQGFGRTGLNVPHVFMNKFRGPRDINFKLVADRLRDFVDRAPTVLQYRESCK